MFSDTTGQFEAVIFSDTLTASRPLARAGNPVVVSVEAEYDGETIKYARPGYREPRQRRRRRTLPFAHYARRRRSLQRQADLLLAELRDCLKPGRDEIRLVVTCPTQAKQYDIMLPGRL